MPLAAKENLVHCISLAYVVLLVCSLCPAWPGLAPWPDATTGALPWWFYGVAMANFVLYRLACNVMFVSLMAFFSRIADPAIGGTYVLECLSGDLLVWKRADSLTGAH